ncbi:DUF4292 domain-containing protein [Gangjinia marincola]|uniref:DUF4292 domain-containing protein n=1 Tax=Gangjinia marincola TaxID=578463 RepID=A0ABN1MIR7_9FLAO
MRSSIQNKIKGNPFIGPIRVLYAVLIAGLLLTSCKSTKRIISADGTSTSAVEIIRQHNTAAPSFKTLQSRLRINYSDAKKSQSVTISLRMEKDKTIWMSAKFAGLITVAKAMITPDKVQYYEKIGGTYFDGDFDIISKFLGTPLTFNQLQNVLLGQVMDEVTPKKVEVTFKDNFIQLTPKKELGNLRKLFLLQPSTLKTAFQQIDKVDSGEHLEVSYTEYQRIGDKLYPQNVEILARQKDETSQIKVEFRGIELNDPMSFPFSIPSGYEEITVE